MTHPPPEKPVPPPKRNSKMERAMLLRDAVEQAVAVEKEAARPQRYERSNAGRIAMLVLCVPLAAFCVYSFVAKPEFIWGPRTPAVSPQRIEASARMAMYLAARRAELFKSRDGEYPATLAEFSPDTALGYRKVGAGFEITATVSGKQLLLRSTDDLTAFLGNSTDLIQQKVGR